MKLPKLAIIGVGNIANDHVPALKKAGFNITSCAGSPNSKNVLKFSKNIKLKMFFLIVLNYSRILTCMIVF